MPEVAMLHGRADPAHDGVADYTARLVAALREHGTVVRDVPVDPGPRGALAAARAARGADVVHLQFAPSAYRFSSWPGLLGDLVRAPLVTTVHEYGWWSPRPWRLPARLGLADAESGRLVPRSATVITTNGAHEEALRRRHPRAQVLRLPIPPNVVVAPDADRATTRRRLRIAENAQVVVFFGFVHPVKGLRYLIDAVARLAGEHPRLHLLIVGGFTSLALPDDEAAAFRAELTKHVADAGATDRVTITGHLPADEVSSALAAADLAAFPFTAGATTKSGALLAAFDHGLPTIVTQLASDTELVDGETVVVAPAVRDVDVLVTALRRLLDDPALAARVAAGGRSLLDGRDWQTLAACHHELYAGLA
ncbi:glycosyltransferase family 4 protein [Actinomycetospora termitidis]|uniref:Glycosyltransferase family 4 protein n=1 Tax=Actinomycetospora termitidis TaxID=3053470 RepID=A0ABT7MEI6_9PSEU|nr:glycosyltransferase family 4 protein [Actinomycetospora sp. Odt1-22]MDL5157783.1 glycosyltransferase family 4 protein [Actinomycetospora sp. Odt1-22]